MGTWSVSVTGNDTAQDLKIEYTCAFYYYGVEKAIEKIEDYAAMYGFDKSDPEEYCAYVYSLADFMWKKGILTEDIKNRALRMVDEGFGLEIWEHEGEKTLKARKKALEKFKAQITSPMCNPKIIKPDAHTEAVFKAGDVIAVKLMTAGKNYVENKCIKKRKVTAEEFMNYDGKYILIQKITDHCSWTSHIAPEVKDLWAIFKLFEGIYDDVPQDINIKSLKPACVIDHDGSKPYFMCESSMFYFMKRGYQVIGNYEFDAFPVDPNDIKETWSVAANVYFGINRPWYNADSILISVMGNLSQRNLSP